MSDPLIFVAAFSTSLLLGLLFIARPTLLVSSEHMLRDLGAPQAQHTRPTPRVGGVGIVFGLLIGCLLYIDNLGSELILALLAGVVVFWMGLREDIHRNVSPRTRLTAAIISGALAIGFTGILVPDLGLMPGSLQKWVLPAIVVTLLWSSGTCHALNLIDGLNGLSSLYCISACLGFVIIAGHTGDSDIQIVAGLLVAAVLGFFLLNWPMGRIFLGDAGAYGIGHILAWLGIILIARNPSVAPMAVLLLLFWPVCDTLFSIIRRRASRRATGQPDRLHFHHLAVRALPLLLGRRPLGSIDNPAATILLLPLFGIPILAGVWLWDQPVTAALALVFFIAAYMVTYVFGMRYLAKRSFRKQRLIALPIHRRKKSYRQKSPLSGTYTQDSETLDVQIIRVHPKGPWLLRVTAAGTDDLVYTYEFETDVEAYEHFVKAA